jgi:hypothetical protein
MGLLDATVKSVAMRSQHIPLMTPVTIRHKIRAVFPSMQSKQRNVHTG